MQICTSSFNVILLGLYVFTTVWPGVVLVRALSYDSKVVGSTFGRSTFN